MRRLAQFLVSIWFGLIAYILWALIFPHAFAVFSGMSWRGRTAIMLLFFFLDTSWTLSKKVTGQ